MNEFVESRLQLKRKVLVVDDEAINLKILEKILSVDYDVILSDNGDDALKKVKENKDTLSLILLDLLMPGTDGFSVLQILRSSAELKHIPVIVLTSETSAEVQSLKMGAADFIPKPYNVPEVILARIGKTIQLFENINIVSATQNDELTGLYNRDFFMEYAGVIDQYYPDTEMDAIVLNVNRFHIINELYGRSFGDSLLGMIGSSVLDHILDKKGIACRYNADGFFIYMPHCSDPEELFNSLADGISGELSDARSRIRMGIYPNADKNIDLHKRFDSALLACNSIKGDFNKHLAYYDQSMHEQEAHRERLAGDMEKALADHEFIVYYQPKFNIRGEKPLLSSAEALIRWKHPELGMISPGEFIPVFEENGMIRRLDRFVWKEAARQVAEWKKKYGIAIPVSVNVSRIDMMEPGFVEEITGMLKECGIGPGEYMLEVTESAYTEDSDRIIAIVNSLRKLGFMIEMDDFGTGYSSLNMLSSLPIDVLKLDMGFVKSIHENEKDLKMVELIMDIAKYLDLKVVAEGVEHEEQYKLLKDIGVHIIQGYYFSKPIPAEEFAKLIEERIDAEK